MPHQYVGAPFSQINSEEVCALRCIGTSVMYLFIHSLGCWASFYSAQPTELARVVQAGVVPMDTAAVASELQGSWNREDAMEWANIYTKIFPAYQLLIESYIKAQDVAKSNELLDSQRK
ncbi:hypothetical protein [Candidatus Nitrotoga arctica]|nr:hypothetical protein [Candidatus Nitrotoga arctica]